MTTQATGPLAGIRWLRNGINLGRQNAGAVFGGAAIVALAALLPAIVQVLVQMVVQPGPDGMMFVAALSTILSVIIMAPLVGGYLRLIDASEHGRPAAAMDVFAAFRAGGDAGRLIGFGVLMTLVYVAIAMALIAMFGEGFMEWYMQIARLQAEAGAGGRIDPGQVPQLPEGAGRLMAAGSIVFLFLSGVYAIGFGQIALAGRSIGPAVGEGVVGTAKNLLPILLLAAVVVLVSIPLLLIVTIVFALVGGIGGLFHPVVAAILVLPLYFALMIALYVVMFGVMYYLWRDVCAGGASPASAPHQVEL